MSQVRTMGIGDNTEEVMLVLGTITYRNGREYPWECKKDCVIQFFATRQEAMEHLINGTE